MLSYTYFGKEDFRLTEKPVPELRYDTDALVKVTLCSICTSDLHILHSNVPRAVPGITVGHEAVGVVVATGKNVKKVKIGDRVSVNVETFCGKCWFCRRGYVNNCASEYGGWALGCRIDGMQAEYVRVPFADTGLTPIPDNVGDRQALLAGDILATGFWAAKISEIRPGDSVLVIGAGPTGICSMACAFLRGAGRVYITDIDEGRLNFAAEHYPDVVALRPGEVSGRIKKDSSGRGADRVIEAAGTEASFRLAWEAARPNAVVSIIAMYDAPQVLPLPEMYGKNLTFKTGGVDGNDAKKILSLISAGKLDVSALITHTYRLSEAAEAYELFASRRDGVMKVALDCTR